MHYIPFYEVIENYVERRAQFRNLHLEQARKAHERGELVLAGALAEPVDGAVLVFRSLAAAEAFTKTDPYVTNRLVTKWHIRKWATVVGDGAAPV